MAAREMAAWPGLKKGKTKNEEKWQIKQEEGKNKIKDVCSNSVIK